MKHSILLLLIVLSGTCTKARKLYPVRDGDRWGFIDSAGRMAVPALYRNVNAYREGLAAVREHGTYGYIDERGTVVIPAQFDWGEPFAGGMAIVYRAGKPYVIDRSGRVLFEHPFVRIARSGVGGLWKVVTVANHAGLVNSAGHLVIDTSYDGMGSFENGRAPVFRVHSRRGESNYASRSAIIDTAGNFIVPFGTYEHIEAIQDGYYHARLLRDTSAQERREKILDRKGRVVTNTSAPGWYISEEEFRDGGTPVSIQKPRTKKDSIEHTYPDSYYGVMDRTGKLLFSDTSWCSFIPFSTGRAFAGYSTEGRNYANKWILIDRGGRRVGPEVYDKVYYEDHGRNDAFIDGVAFVSRNDSWTAIDTNGRELFSPVNLDSATDGSNIRISKRMGRVLILSEDISTEDESYSYKYGIWDTRDGTLLRPIWYDLSVDTAVRGLNMVMNREGKFTAVTHGGREVWRESALSAAVKALDIDYMNRGYFYASGPARKDLAGYGGWAHSDNSPSREAGGEDRKLRMVITKEPSDWRKVYCGRKVYLRNGTKDTIYFNAQDSRLYMKVEALDEQGIWKDVEYLPSSWCGNSYHMVALPPRQYWSFVTPDYEGSFKTKLRISVLYVIGPERRGGTELTLYSNEVDGSINPAQFWRKREYFPGGIMDPYND